MASKDKGRYRVRVKGGRGKKRISRTFPLGTPKSKVDAFEQEVRSGSVDWARIKECPTLDEYADHFLKTWPKFMPGKRREKSTIVGDIGILENHLLPAFGDRRLIDIEPADIMDLQATLYDRGTKPQTIRNVVAKLAVIMKLAVIERKIVYNPCASVPRISRDERATPSEKARLNCWDFVEKAKFMDEVLRRHLLLSQLAAVGTNAGPRIGELEGLLGDSWNLEEGFVVWQRTFCTKERRIKDRTKGGLARKVYLPPEVIKLCWSLKDVPADEPVFARRLNFNRVSLDLLKPICEETKIRVITPHGWRHTFATHLLRLGRQVKEVSEALGHKKTATTLDTYAHVFEEDRKVITAGLNANASWMIDMNARVDAFSQNGGVQNYFKPRNPRGSTVLELVSSNGPQDRDRRLG